MNSKLIWILLMGFFFATNLVEAQVQRPTTTGGASSSNSNIENQSIFGERTTKSGLKIRPIFIPFIGGGASSTNGFSNIMINVNPMAGIAINSNFRTAAGPIFEYARFDYTNVRLRTWGANVFAQYNLLDLDDFLGVVGSGMRVFLHGEYAIRHAKDLETQATAIINSLPLGAGVTQPIGNRTSFQAMVLYNPLDASLYENSGLTYRVGVGVGF